jgi:hypothetical protein
MTKEMIFCTIKQVVKLSFKEVSNFLKFEMDRVGRKQ